MSRLVESTPSIKRRDDERGHDQPAGILHVDMDAFFASVEVLKDPSLVGRAVIVGGTGQRGVVASASYEARAFGVRSAMPSSKARQLCPQAVWKAPDFSAYSHYSQLMRSVLNDFTPIIEPLGLDEAFLDVAGSRRLFGLPEAIAVRIRDRIAAELGLGVSVGVGSNKLIAKLASKAAKPTGRCSDQRGPEGKGILVVPSGSEAAFVEHMNVRQLWGVGPATADRLERIGVKTASDVRNVDESLLGAHIGNFARTLRELAWGRDHRPVQSERPIKSVSRERTYERDMRDETQIGSEVFSVSVDAAARLKARGLLAKTVTLKVRYEDFTTVTRSRSLDELIEAPDVIAQVAKELLAQLDLSKGVRLVGVGLTNLSDEAETLVAHQLAFSFEDVAVTEPEAPAEEALRALQACERVRARFGSSSLGAASSLLSDIASSKATSRTRP